MKEFNVCITFDTDSDPLKNDHKNLWNTKWRYTLPTEYWVIDVALESCALFKQLIRFDTDAARIG